MKQALTLVTLGVGDLARSRAFYRALGWRESSASQEAIAFYQAGSTAFAPCGGTPASSARASTPRCAKPSRPAAA